MSEDRLRVDKWLWHARFLKTRGLAAALVEAGEVSVNGIIARKPSLLVKPGDEVVFTLNRRRRRVRVLGMGERRGPAPEAQGLYEELEPPVLVPVF